jgi:hypothetical protein
MWSSLGGTWITSPHAVRVGPEKVALFVVGTDHVTRVRWRIDGEWGGWTALTGKVIQVPHAVAGSGDRVDLFAVDPRHAILHREWQGAGWTDWTPMTGEVGGPTITAPRAVWSTDDRLDVFALGTNLGIWHKWRDGDKWSEKWTQVGSLWLTPPHVLSRAPGTIDAVAINSESGLAHAQFRDGRWSGWQTDDQISISRPFAVYADGAVHVFVLGENRGLYHYTRNGEWSKPVPLQGTAVSAPRAVAWPAGGMDVFVVGEDSAVFYRSWRDGDWRDWVSLGGSAFSPPSLVSHDDGLVELFVLGHDSAIWHTSVLP